MSEVDSFFDTNVLLYLLSNDAAKADRAEALLASGGVVSVQVLNEFASVAKRKLVMRSGNPKFCQRSKQSVSLNHWTLRPTSLGRHVNVIDFQSMTA
jgi:predicted nucleic acid-binding protein